MFFFTFWILIGEILCSSKVISDSGSLWGIVSSLASTIIPLKGSIDNTPNYAKLFECECSLIQKFTKMSESIKTMNEEIFTNWKPVKFPEASAFSALFVRDIGAYMDAWMDLNESKKIKEGSRVLSQHILWVRSVGSKSATSYFIYRPSFVAELESSSILPHLRYHAEAQETVQKVIEVVENFPNDQIIFAGLQSGGAIAMLHAWMVVSAVPIVYRNLKEFKGELHQLKVFLFDTDCVLSETYARNFPIPSWDVLRFYSRMSTKIYPDSCSFESMKAIGLSYVYKPRFAEYWLGDGGSSDVVDRVKFVDYYDKATAEFELKEADENIDNGISDAFDDGASISESEISMSFDGNESRQERQQHNHHHDHDRLRSGLTKKTSQPPVPAKNIDALIEKGIGLLSESVKISGLFFKNSKEIYSKQQTGYLRRNVEGCAAAMQRNLINSLLGKETESPVVEKGIKDVQCSVERYDVKTKVALIICTLLSKDLIKSPILRFRTHLQNEMDEILTQRDISVAINDWEEISMADYSCSTASESNSNPIPISSSAGGGRARQGSSVSEDLFFDDRSIITGFQEKSELWASCLDELFDKSSQLNFINPTGNYTLKESDSEVESSNPGRSILSIELPFATTTVGVCEFNLLTQPKNFYQLYRVSPSMFFSIFSEAIQTHPFPSVCSNILEPPSISRKYSGNAEKIAGTLNGFFNSDGSSDINHKNVIVNGLEIQESFTNLPSNNPYEIFKPALCGKLAECLAQKVLEKLYDCNSHLTLWAGKHHCPETCFHRPSGFGGGQPLHLCSRVLNCGDGIYLGFRGSKLFGLEKHLSEEFGPYTVLSKVNPPAYFSAFHLKTFDGWKQFRFAVFFDEDARNSLINGGSSIVPSSSTSVRSAFTGVLSNTKILKAATAQVDDHEEYDVASSYTMGRKRDIQSEINYAIQSDFDQHQKGHDIVQQFLENDNVVEEEENDDEFHGGVIDFTNAYYNEFGGKKLNEADEDIDGRQEEIRNAGIGSEFTEEVLTSTPVAINVPIHQIIHESPTTTIFTRQMSADNFQEPSSKSDTINSDFEAESINDSTINPPSNTVVNGSNGNNKKKKKKAGK